VNLVSFALWTVSFNFFRNIHLVLPALHRRNIRILIPFRFCAENVGFFRKWLFLGMAAEIFLLRLLPVGKLRLSAVALCVLGCFSGLGFEALCELRLSGWALVLAGKLFTPLAQ